MGQEGSTAQWGIADNALTERAAARGAQPRRCRREPSAPLSPLRPRPGTRPATAGRGLPREARILLALGAGIVVLFAVVLGVGRLLQPEGQAAPAASDRLVREDSPVLGAPGAPVTLVEFLDPECESCGAAQPIVKRLLTEYEGRVRLVVRYFPLHANSVAAAVATEAAGEQGKYWEMQDLLFTNQPQWGEQRTPQVEAFERYAGTLGLDTARFRAAADARWATKIERDRADGLALGVRGTATFFVNGQQVRELSYGALKAAIDAALRA
jgi:protein-disulfide isomerase